MIRRFRRDRSGSIAVETALIAGVFLTMIFGTIELGRYAWLRNVLIQTAYAGARCAGLRAVACSNAPANSTDVRVYDYNKTLTYIISTAARRGVRLTSSNITITALATCSGAANFVRVDIARLFGSNWLAATGLDDVNITASACFPQQP